MIDDRFALPADVDERTLLTCFLDWHRQVLARKCAGLTDEQLRTHAVPSSNVTLIGLLRHMASVELFYFQVVVAGERPSELFERDTEFDDIADATGARTLAIWQAQVDKSRKIVAARDLDATSFNPARNLVQSLRWVCNHMIDEYARHNGHADLIREAIDGQTGE